MLCQPLKYKWIWSVQSYKLVTTNTCKRLWKLQESCNNITQASTLDLKHSSDEYAIINPWTGVAQIFRKISIYQRYSWWKSFWQKTILCMYHLISFWRFDDLLSSRLPPISNILAYNSFVLLSTRKSDVLSASTKVCA